jgi:CRISPR-associated protein Csx10
MNGFLYTLTLQEPVLASSLGGEPNSANSLYYIPGGAIRGAAILAYGSEDNAAEPNFQRLFLNGETRFLHAYPLMNKTRVLPTPLSWQVERKPVPGAEKKVFKNIEAVPPKEGTDEKLDTKSATFSFWQINDQALHSADEKWQVNIHTQRDAVRGRATTDAGAVYRYISLPAGMKLQGAVITQDAADARKIEALLKDKIILLGKARTAGYGHAKVDTAPMPENWRELDQPFEASETFTLTLLSPMLVRDNNGQFSLDIEPALSARLGVTPKMVKTERHTEIIGGFNRKWGLPLPQVTAIAAGSVFTVKVNVTAGKLLELESTGIGQRRAEGFGRVAVNLVVPNEMKWEANDPDLDPLAEGSLAAGDPLAKLMLTRLLRRDLDEQVLHCARNAVENYNGSVPNSQLSRWRVIVRDALEKLDIQRLQKFAADSKGKPGWKKMEKAKINFNGTPHRLTEWIEALLENPKMLNQAWENGIPPERKLGLNSISLNADLNAEYRLRLLDAVLAIMSKKSGGKDGN